VPDLMAASGASAKHPVGEAEAGPDGTAGAANPWRRAAGLAEEIRQEVTPVVGFLELIATDNGSLPREQRIRWAAKVERHLGVLRELIAETEQACRRSGASGS
jgi:hypothetical protein